MYFSLVSALLMAPFHFNLAQVSTMLRSFWKNTPLSFFQLVIAVTASLLSVHFFRRKLDAVLVPTPLIEFRYYTIPFFFFFFSLHSHTDDYRNWVLAGIAYIAINIFTMYMFLFRPFQWDHEPGIQRFIWQVKGPQVV